MSVDQDEKQETSWKTLLDCGKASDTKTLSDWKDELGILLTFTGLFSAVVTGFIVLAIPLLQEDSGEKSARLLAQISLQLSSFHVSSQFINSTASVNHTIVETFQPDVQAVRINILWISSLTCTLMASFFTIAAQQWIRCIPLPPHLTIREAIRLRQYRQDGLIRWKVPTMISLLPVVVQISVVLFLAGLLLLLSTINSTVATVFAVLAGSTLGFFVITVLLPVIVANCPFKTPFVPTVVAVGQFCAIPIIGVLIVAGWIVGGVLVAIGVSAWNIQRATMGFIERISKRPLRTRSTRRPDFAPVYNTFRDVFILRCLHAISAIFRRWFWTNGEYWLSHELASTNDAELDRNALSHAPTFVPKDQLAVLRPSLDALPIDHRLHVATSWARHSMSLSSKSGLLLNSSLHAMSYTGPLRHAPRSAFLELRETLWHVLPKAWDPEWHDDQNRILSMMLCLLFRSLPGDANAEPEFFAAFGKRLFDIRNSQDMGSVMPEDSLSANASIIPTSLLFHCCQRGVVLDRDQILAASAWTSSLHIHIRTNILHQEQVNPHMFRPDIMRVGEISITSAAVVFQAVARNQVLLSDEAGRAWFDELVETSAKIIRKLRRSLVTYTSHISVLPTGTHILACNEAIKGIARSVVVLTEEGNIAQRPDCPSRKIMSYLREVCEANWERTFEDTMVCFDQYDALYVERYGTQAQ